MGGIISAYGNDFHLYLDLKRLMPDDCSGFGYKETRFGLLKKHFLVEARQEWDKYTEPIGDCGESHVVPIFQVKIYCSDVLQINLQVLLHHRPDYSILAHYYTQNTHETNAGICHPIRYSRNAIRIFSNRYKQRLF